MTKIRNDQWSKLYTYLRGRPDMYVGKETECRRFIEGGHWIMRTGAQWRELPTRYGNWNSVSKRFARWCDKGVWEQMQLHFAHDPDLENLIIDSTVVRAHPCTAGASKKTVQDAQALGRSRGGFSTTTHVHVDALGNPLRFLLTAGQCHDSTQAVTLIAEYAFERLIADKSYDVDTLLHQLAESGVEAIIPPRSNRTQQRDYDKHLYTERHLVECFINKVKQYRRIFSRFDKLAIRYLGFLSFAGALIWLR